MKVIDEKGRLFGKLNVIDLLALLLVAAVAVFLVVKLAGRRAAPGPSANTGGGATVTYTVTVYNARPESYEVIRRFVDKDAGKKDRLMTGTQLLDGYVIDCVAVPHISYTTDADGQIKTMRSTGDDDRIDLTFTVEAVVTNTITNAVGSQEVRVGNGQYVKTTHFDFYGTILSAQWSYED